MVSLIITLITTLGATGMGSAFKMVAGFISSMSEVRSANADRELIRELERTKLSASVQKSIFGGNSVASSYARVTRRILAIMAGLTFMICMICFAIYPSIPLITFATAAGGSSTFSLLWGLITFPAIAAGTTVVITTGHMLLVGFATISCTFGFYFTPTYDPKRSG